MTTRRNFIKSAGGLALAGAGVTRLTTPALAETWPTRPVHVIVPLAPGGAIDYVARQCAQVMSPVIGQQMIVENHTGAGGTLGMDLVMKSAPDGYTVLVTNDNAASARYILKLNYDYTQVLTPVIDLAHQPQVFAVHPSLGVNSIAEFVAYAKQHPNLGFASSGVGTNQHVIGLWFAREAGIKLEHVPYRGAGAAVGDLIGGHVKSAFLGPTALINHHRAGTIKILAQSSAKRAPTLPDIPTLEESGYKGLVLEAWYAVFLPGNTPKDIVAQVNAAYAKALKDENVLDGFTKGSLEAKGGTPEDLNKLARADSAKYEKLIAELGITAG
jgi:tripartite-type tricarboxylate transporter receptor subunit TctC